MYTIDIENNVQLDRLLITNPDMEKKVRGIVRKVIASAMGTVQAAADRQSTKQAAQAIRKAVYKKILGGNINILDSRRRAGGRAPLPPESPRKRSHAVGGNRIPRSRRTEDLLTYTGRDRAFILRFLNSGTASRHNGYRPTGAIAARNWFPGVAEQALANASEKFDQLIAELIEQEFNK